MVSYGPTQETYTAENLAETYGGPVIMLGPDGAAATVAPPHAPSHPPHAPHPVEHPHHRHIHEPLGREHD